MTTMEALEVKEALLTLEKTTGSTANEIANIIMIIRPSAKLSIMEASRLWNEFYDADLVERGRLIGLKIREVANDRST